MSKQWSIVSWEDRGSSGRLQSNMVPHSDDLGPTTIKNCLIQGPFMCRRQVFIEQFAVTTKYHLTQGKSRAEFINNHYLAFLTLFFRWFLFISTAM